MGVLGLTQTNFFDLNDVKFRLLPLWQAWYSCNFDHSPGACLWQLPSHKLHWPLAWSESLIGPNPRLTACTFVMRACLILFPVHCLLFAMRAGMKLGVVGLGGLGHMAVKFGKAMGLEVSTHCD